MTMADTDTPENRDPFECPQCGTVNVWNATICRDCKSPISKAEALSTTPSNTSDASIADENGSSENMPFENGEPTQMDSTVPGMSSPKRRWNVFWIVLGIAIHVAGVHLGVFSIIKFLVEPDAELKETIEQTLAAAKSGTATQESILKNLNEPLKSKLSTIRWMLIVILAVVPILIGLFAGFFTGTILDGAAAMGLSAVLIPLLNGAAEFAIIWGPVNAALGALGAFLGIRIAIRLKGETAFPSA